MQEIYARDVLGFGKCDEIDREYIKDALMSKGVELAEAEIDAIFQSLKFAHNDTNKVSRLEVYANGHILRLKQLENYDGAVDQILRKIIM